MTTRQKWVVFGLLGCVIVAIVGLSLQDRNGGGNGTARGETPTVQQIVEAVKADLDPALTEDQVTAIAHRVAETAVANNNTKLGVKFNATTGAVEIDPQGPLGKLIASLTPSAATCPSQFSIHTGNRVEVRNGVCVDTGTGRPYVP